MWLIGLGAMRGARIATAIEISQILAPASSRRPAAPTQHFLRISAMVDALPPKESRAGFLYFSGPNDGKRFCFQGNARSHTSTDYAKLDAVELPHLDPFGSRNVDRK